MKHNAFLSYSGDIFSDYFLLCLSFRHFSLFSHAISRKNALFRIRYLVDAVLGDDEVSVDGDGRDGEGGHEDT